MRRLLIVLLLVSAASGSAVACLWDHDTLAMERQRFPTALEMITGKFLRHTPEFYKWRIADREKKLKADPYNPALTDDLAVAWDKLGDHKRAIALMTELEKRHPGLYETAANLGTFYVHDRQWVEARGWLVKALAINPNARFGRERYQLRLFEYSKGTMKHGKSLRLPFDENGLCVDGTEQADDEAVTAVLGMMRFDNHDSPTLLNALADLLVSGRKHYQDQNAKQLAARAYLRVSYADPASFRERARRALMPHIAPNDLEARLRREIAEADVWLAEVREDELRWIREGKDPEAEFDRKYYANPPSVSDDSEGSHTTRWVVISAVILLVCLLATWPRRKRLFGR